MPSMSVEGHKQAAGPFEEASLKEALEEALGAKTTQKENP